MNNDANTVHEDYMERNRQRRLNDFPTKADLIKRIEDADADSAKYHEECASIMEEIKNEKNKLPGLSDEIKKAERDYAIQRAVIERLENKAERVRSIESSTGQKKWEYQAQLDNGDWKRNPIEQENMRNR